jgi:predicted lipoprotein
MDAGSSAPRSLPRAVIGVGVAIAVIAFFWAFPLFRIVRLDGGAASIAGTAAAGSFDPAAMAAKLWSGELQAAAQRAADVNAVTAAIRTDPAAARSKYARSVGMGAAYYFVRGSGKVIARDRNTIRIALDGPNPAIVALRIGPIFGNAVRDGSGLLDVNQVPGLHEFNALAAELNKLVESQVLTGLREGADVGAVVTFAGCAEAPESAAPPDQPLLIIIPVVAEVRE